jgi:hypothetical protein
VERSTQLPGVISQIKPGNDARLEVWRDNPRRSHGEDRGAAGRSAEGFEPRCRGAAKADKLGLSVRPLGADERKSAETEAIYWSKTSPAPRRRPACARAM